MLTRWALSTGVRSGMPPARARWMKTSLLLSMTSCRVPAAALARAAVATLPTQASARTVSPGCSWLKAWIACATYSPRAPPLQPVT